ncbi:septal ring factor EnvC (AmiA/AmiB activator) [Rhodobacter aestuarii]|uniref:Septal ring factor EnvC, activator of murein hydrolases AmiA and AmiB n=1 Tax=Rhodobacter aestuarii TaxID=453582 RepID=A0A1N7LEJ2_9RHOB|nr:MULTISPECIES: peptidase M23 [Rhodobacter]PTV95294.1 septal ring factor EnvC (AmiA/AmiB activator) [Rhodobacter aestuarii]SIS72259.1 Septal ring factor EnvC, activator of murein hydrolases AmiA and AmiB [Rhodobacter aestuarii]SOC08193.1 septal ring factor EnvC (AmiA/AmiB activator) [Rhodobacter sp. JA431]
MIRAAVVALCLSAGVAMASPAADVAQQAADDLRAAIAALDAAQSRADRVAALTQTITAYETGLGALRDGLRRAAIREGEIRAQFEAKREDIGRLLGVMSTMSQSEGPLLLLHPSGPLGSARSGMILGSVTPALNAEADLLRADLAEIDSLRAVQSNAAQVLETGLGSVQAARTALSKAISERKGLPQRYLEEPEELRQLVESVDTLEGFASGIVDLDSDIGPPMEDFEGAKGRLPMPVLGRVLRAFNEADAAGIRRPGLVVATAPAALVTTPWPATIRYRGPLLDYANVMILEPAEGYLLVLAGLGAVYGETGDVLAAGAPIGLMGGLEPGAQEFGEDFVRNARMGSGAGRTETLYIELREGKEPIDPASWFAQTSQNKG